MDFNSIGRCHNGGASLELPSNGIGTASERTCCSCGTGSGVCPFFPYAHPYAYAPYYAVRNYGYVKTECAEQDAVVYVDGGYAAKIDKTKKLALRPGNHDIELRGSDGRTFFQERVAVMVGQTTKVDVPPS
jgi:hypothetical protein